MKAVKKLRKLAAFLLTVFLLTGEFYSAGFAVYAAGDAEEEAAAAEEQSFEEEDAQTEEAEEAAEEDEVLTEDAEEAADPAEEEEEAAPEADPLPEDEEISAEEEEPDGDREMIQMDSIQINNQRVVSGDAGTGWIYKDQVLELTDFTLEDHTSITKTMIPIDGFKAQYGIYSSHDLTIIVNGNCKISMEGDTSNAFTGIYVKGNLTISNKGSGNGSLTINSPNTLSGGCGIYCEKDLKIGLQKKMREALIGIIGKPVRPGIEVAVTLPGSLKVSADGNSFNRTLEPEQFALPQDTAGIRTKGDLEILGADVVAYAGINMLFTSYAVEVDGKIAVSSGKLTGENGGYEGDKGKVCLYTKEGLFVSDEGELKAEINKSETWPGEHTGFISEGDVEIRGKADFKVINGSQKGTAVKISKGKSVILNGCYIVTPDEGIIGEKDEYQTVLDTDGNTANEVYIKNAVPYDIWLGSTRIDSENSGDLSSAVTGSGSVSYNAATNTLTLPVVNAVKGSHKLDGESGLIVSKQPLTIVSVVCALSAPDSVDHVILMDDACNLRILGLGIQLTSKESAIKTKGNSRLLIDESITNVILKSTGDHGAELGGGLTIKAGTLTVTGEENGIHSQNGTVELEGGKITANSGSFGTTYAIYAQKINYDPDTTVIEDPEEAVKYDDNGHEIILDKEKHAAKKVVLVSSLTPIDDLKQDSITYGEELPEPVWTKHDGEVTFSYDGTLAKDGSSYGPTSEKPVEVGTYFVTVTEVKDETIYRGRSSFQITPKTLTVSASPRDAEFVFTGDSYVRLKDVQLVGVVEPDEVRLDEEEVYGIMEDENVGVDKPVNKLDSFLGLDGADAANYVLDYNLTGITVTVTKAQKPEDKVTYHVEGGKNYSELLPVILEYDESVDPTISYKEGQDQLDGNATLAGNVLNWKMKAELTTNVVMEITIKGGTNYEDHKLVVTLQIPHLCAEHIEKVEAQAPTCLDPGYGEHYACTICGKIFEDETGTKEITDPEELLVPALGHDWDNGVITVAPTKTTPGTRVYTCKRCGETKTESAYYVHSGLDPVPENLDSCTELYLVKGQKFSLPTPSGKWEVKKEDKRYLNISKTGMVSAKKETAAPISISNEAIGRTINVSICKPAIDKKGSSLKLNAGASGTIKLDGVDPHLNVYWYSAKPDVATVDTTGKVSAVSKGTAKITAYVNGKAYSASVKVSEPTVYPERTLHMNLGSSKTLNLKGIKAWKSADDTIATTKNKKGQDTKKITTLKANDVLLTASANDVNYTVKLTVEDITLKTNEKLKAAGGKNKYTLELTVGEVLPLNFVYVQQDLTFKSSKPEIAFANENGVIEARAAGKGKITTSINGKTVTVTVNVKAP